MTNLALVRVTRAERDVLAATSSFLRTLEERYRDVLDGQGFVGCAEILDELVDQWDQLARTSTAAPGASLAGTQAGGGQGGEGSK